MIHLITGTPGAGKTLRALWHLEKAQREGRQCFQDGVEGSQVPGLPGEDWQSVPDGSLVLLDEAQRVFPVRVKVESIPEAVRALETHRHRGIDLVLTTQHPRLLDAHVRRLVGRHEHLRRVAGRPLAAVVEWVECSENLESHKGAASVWKFPRELYGHYKSAVLHTKQGRVPRVVWVFLVLFALGLWWSVSSFSSFMGAMDAPVAESGSGGIVEAIANGGPVVPGTSVAGPARGGAGPAPRVFTPAVAGAAWSAPAYAEAERVVSIPYPRGCIASASRCRCGTGQGTWLDVPPALCRLIVADGFFIPGDGGPSGASGAASARLLLPGERVSPEMGGSNVGPGVSSRSSPGLAPGI